MPLACGELERSQRVLHDSERVSENQHEHDNDAVQNDDGVNQDGQDQTHGVWSFLIVYGGVTISLVLAAKKKETRVRGLNL